MHPGVILKVVDVYNVPSITDSIQQSAAGDSIQLAGCCMVSLQNEVARVDSRGGGGGPVMQDNLPTRAGDELVTDIPHSRRCWLLPYGGEDRVGTPVLRDGVIVTSAHQKLVCGTKSNVGATICW